MIDAVKRYGAVAAATTAIIAALSAAWAAADYLEVRPVILKEVREIETQLAATTRAVELQRWQFLLAKLRANGSLDAAEQFEFCALGKRLGFSSPGCA